MKKCFPRIWPLLGVTIVAGCLIPPSAHAQEAETYSEGLVPLSAEEFAKLPKTPTYRAFLPERVDLSTRFPSVGDQGRQGSCVAWAVGYSARAYYAATAEGRNVRTKENIPSPAFIYNSIRSSSDCDGGSQIYNALNLLQMQGSLSLKDYPYRENSCSPPSEAQRLAAKDFKIESWLTVDFAELDQVKGELSKGHPVVVGMLSSKELKNLKRGQVINALTEFADGRREKQSFHAVSVVGYDEHLQAFRFINSWGANWGDNGFGWIGYNAFKKAVREAYVMRPMAPLIPDPQPKPAPSPTPGPLPPPAPTPAPEVRPAPAPAPTPARLPDFPCSQLGAETEAGKLSIVGFVSTDADLEKIQGIAKERGAKAAVTVKPWPQCELLLTLNKELSVSDRPTVAIEKVSGDLKEGQLMQFSVKTPNYPSFLHAAYIQADGSVVNLVQTDSSSLKALPPRSNLKLGDPAGLGPKFKVSSPFGRELLVVVASRSPLFPSVRPQLETERSFLTALRAAIVASPAASGSERVISAGFDSIVTSESGIVWTEPKTP